MSIKYLCVTKILNNIMRLNKHCTLLLLICNLADSVTGLIGKKEETSKGTD